MKNNNLCIIQARTGSTRLPNKVLLKVGRTSLLEYEINRVGQAKKIDKIVIATTVKREDDRIEKLCHRINVECIRGPEDDVLDRYFQGSLNYPSFRNIIRLTGDCPLIDPAVIDEVIRLFEKSGCDFASNVETGKETFPDGLDVEIFKKGLLEEAAQKATLPSDREHVDEYMLRNRKYRKAYLTSPIDWSHFRLTVDEPEDFEVIKFLIKNCKATAGYLEYLAVLTKHPDIMLLNGRIGRNEGYLKSLEKDKIFLKNKHLKHYEKKF